MAGTAIVLCADDHCKHNSGGGYYGVCKHPVNEGAAPYCGIDRSYVQTCRLCERDAGCVTEIPDEIVLEEKTFDFLAIGD